MATTLSGAQVRFNLVGTETTAIGAATRVMQMQSPAGTYTAAIANGTSNSQGNTMFSITGTVGTTPTDIDLTNLALASVDDPLTLTGIKSFLIQETSSPIGTNFLMVGDSSGTLTNAWTAPWTLASGQEKISSGGAWARNHPLGLTVDGTHKILRIFANTGTVAYQIDGIGTK